MPRRKTSELIPWILATGSVLVIMGCLFKIQYWPGASFMLMTGLLLEAAGVPLLIFYLWKNRSEGGK